MNTQRPEWNDANNALVGGGLSVVTLCYLHRALAFYRRVVAEAPDSSFTVSREVLEWMEGVRAALALDGTQEVMDALGEASTAYREKLYSNPFAEGRATVRREDVLSFFAAAMEPVARSIRANRRDDGLYHSYNIIELSKGRFAGIRTLAEMLEGQVAVLSSGVLSHREFTGRSGTFYAYEGLGSIYWHMVSKLLVATQECYFAALDDGAPETDSLAARYRAILEGTGIHKTPLQYGAFPTDAYSHTPWGKGVRQPGMTGQVKEDILCRFGELGVRVAGGKVSFHPTLLDSGEFLPDGTLSFSYCGAKVTYRRGGGDGLTLSEADSRRLFARQLGELEVLV